LKKAFDEEGAITKQAAIAIEKRLEKVKPIAKSITVGCIGHAHIDMNWMWGYDETVSITIDTFRTMLALMDEYPEFTFAQSQASVYRIIEEYAPEMLPAIRERVREGRWEVTASTWVETDKNMTSGESHTRHLVYTRKYLKELLGMSDDMFQIDFEPDTFGHNLNVPEILNSGGVRYYYHCRGYDGHNLYKWRSPSGAEVTVFRDPTWYNETIAANSFLYIPGFCAKNKIDKMLCVYGVGDHGGGATRRDIERIIDMDAWPCMPTVRFGRCIDFFKYLDAVDLPVVEQELNFVFDGCYTTQTRIKKANRVSEAALYEAEAMNAISHIYGGYGYNTKAFGSAWENVLFNHFHDILPGSGVIQTREYALGLFQQTMACAGTRKSAAVRSISSKINTGAMLPEQEKDRDSISEGAGVGFGVGFTSGTFFSAGSGAGEFNYTASNAAAGKKRLFNLYNPTQTLKRTTSMITVWDWPGDINKVWIADENGCEVEFEILDKQLKSYWNHEYFRALVLCDIEPFGYRTVLLEENPVYSPCSVFDHPRAENASGFILENDCVKAVFCTNDARLVSFRDKETGEEFIDGSSGCSFNYIQEDDGKGMTSWRVGRHMGVTPLIENVKMTDVSGCLKRGFSYNMPVKNSRLNVAVSLDKNSRMLEYSAECDWREFSDPGKMVPQLSFRIPLAYPCGRYKFDTAFGTVERAGMNSDVPGLSFAFAPVNDGGLMLVSADKYGYRCYDNSISLTLIRSSYEPDGIPECYKHHFSFGIGIIKDPGDKNLIESSINYNHPAITVAAVSQVGELPVSGKFITLESGDTVISSIKMPENGENAMIVRMYSVSDSDGDTVLKFYKPVISASYADAHEQGLNRGTPDISGNAVTVKIRAKSVTTVKVLFN